jgi:hypothetical protein
VLILLVATVLSLVGLAPDSAIVGAAKPKTLPTAPRPLFIYAGVCGSLADVAWPLNDLTSPDGTLAGVADSDRTEYSFTANVPLTIDALLAAPYAINVHESADHPEVTLACGNIGGVPDSIGTLVIGLRLMSELDVTGIAVLSPSPSDATRTLISVFITGSALGHETGTIAKEPTSIPKNPTPIARRTPTPGISSPVPLTPTEVVVPTESIVPTEVVVPTDVVEPTESVEPTVVEPDPTEVEPEPTSTEIEPTQELTPTTVMVTTIVAQVAAETSLN